MKNISLTFQVHQPVRLKRYRFFDIGNDNYYYDDYENERLTLNFAHECYLQNNHILFKTLKKYKGHVKVAFSISGTSIDLFSLYAPEVITSFQQLADTGCVEFLGETYSHSLASLKNIEEYRRQVEAHSIIMTKFFGKRPMVFKNTELIYSDKIGELAAEMGFKAVMAEDAAHFLKGRSPNYLYSIRDNYNLKILFKNNQLSDAIAFGLSNPANKTGLHNANIYHSLLNKLSDEETGANLLIDYEIVREGIRGSKGGGNPLESFLNEIIETKELGFKTPSEIAEEHQPVSEICIPDTIVWADKFASLAKLTGNELQQEALEKLYDIKYRINPRTESDLWKDWQYLQSSDHFYYMSSGFFSESGYNHDLNPYDNPYEAFMNYMNVLSDFVIRVNNLPTREIRYDQMIINTVS
jgi:alpha-amylase